VTYFVAELRPTATDFTDFRHRDKLLPGLFQVLKLLV
jgi:hypothetical protein